jgi:hypothetical protein
MQTKINRDLRGAWQANSRIMLDDKTVLCISTHKTFSGALVTSAAVNHLTDDGFESHTMFGDFHKIIIANKVRVTESAVKAQHDAALLVLDSIKDEIATFYANKEAA